MQYSIISLDTHAIQPFTHLEQGPGELLVKNLHHVNDLLLKIYYISDMSRISAKGTNYFAVAYGLNCRNLNDSVAGHRCAQWKMIEECFRDIHNIGVGYE